MQTYCTERDEGRNRSASSLSNGPLRQRGAYLLNDVEQLPRVIRRRLEVWIDVVHAHWSRGSGQANGSSRDARGGGRTYASSEEETRADPTLQSAQSASEVHILSVPFSKAVNEGVRPGGKTDQKEARQEGVVAGEVVLRGEVAGASHPGAQLRWLDLF